MPKSKVKNSSKAKRSKINVTDIALLETARRSIFDCDDEENVPGTSAQCVVINTIPSSDDDPEITLPTIYPTDLKGKRKITLSSNSDSESSSDEFLRDPASLRDTDFIFPEGIIPGNSNTEKTQDLAETSDTENENNASEYFDFGNIIKSQQLLASLGEKSGTNGNNGKNSTSKQSSGAKKGKDVEDVNVLELLAIGEGEKLNLSVGNSDKNEDTVEVAEEPTPTKNLAITIRLPGSPNKHKKKRTDLDAALKRRLNAIRKESQSYIHKVHVLCLIAHGNHVNTVLNSEDLLGIALSIIPSDKFYPPKHADFGYLQKIVEWFSKKIQIKEEKDETCEFLDKLIKNFSKKEASSNKLLVCMFVCVLRVLGLKCRLIMSLQPVPLRPVRTEPCAIKKEICGKPSIRKNNSGKKSSPTKKGSSSLKGDESLEFYDVGLEGKPSTSKAVGQRQINTSKQKRPIESFDSSSSSDKDKSQGNFSGWQSVKQTKKQEPESDDDFLEVSLGKSKAKKHTVPKKRLKTESKKTGVGTSKSKKEVKSIDRRVLSPDSEAGKKVSKKKIKTGTDVWAEVFLESEEKWISVDVKGGKVHCIHELYTSATHPVAYVFGWNNDQTIKDLTCRYAPQWMTLTKKYRVCQTWLNQALFSWRPRRTALETEEDRDLDRILEEKPLPTSFSEYKHHPLYVLKRHLLKFEAIYPADTPLLGFIRGEPVYSRLYVVDLHSRETWMRKAKVVRRFEKPYKIVKARPKFDKMSGGVVKNLPLQLFGHWQVEDYIPPPAVDGKVPRNEYGNIELYKPCMLPPGTVHLQVPGLNRVARKLDIDCAPAVIGWEFHSGGSHPVFDGFVVCEEFQEILLDAWNKDIDESAKRAKEKREKTIYDNWKRLIRGLLIRDRLQKRYNFGSMPSGSGLQDKKKRKHSDE